MSALVSPRRALMRGALTVATAAATLLVTALPEAASAHGSAADPPARAYDCLQRWSNNHQAPEMASQDPMCYQAWKADPSAMWNWNGLYREGVKGDHRAAIPDGQLCSAGRTQTGRYAALDAVGQWKATPKGRNFSVNIFDQAKHGADYVRVYITRQGFDPTKQQLGWGDLELVSQIGSTPAAKWQPADNGLSLSIDVDAGTRTGRHIVYTIWQASHMDQSYYFCSDVDFRAAA
ncbi:lytic polysaccharide monooxygenase [Dactylosporangium sucinum]|uniref:Chitin-binding protein n=1 Tax=Dactylosporangium sucinum TaxID=1424081 RepID=A0A917UDB5_9ACTN|nr:lytic polysaccharide monooxygenase auxiliary activity family 9 protein [Dactylosporangium sucinum]GGM85004.1 chitin-binding protein [Dactylosporangium sucinum]